MNKQRSTRKIKTWLCLLIALCVLCPMALAATGVRYPALDGVVTDDANALGQQMKSDIQTYEEKLEKQTDVRLYVVMVHFLDGEDAQSYADELFTRAELGENDLLVLGAAGEDRFASVTGSAVRQKLSDANAKNLLYGSGFSALFKSQRYDEAFAKYFVALNDLVAKQYGVNIKLGTLFGGAATPSAIAKPSSESSDLWDQVMSAINDNTREYTQRQQEVERDRDGLSPLGWLVLVLLIGLLFGQSDPARRSRRRSGCGCSPLVWFFSAFGLGKLLEGMGRRHRR